MQIYCIALTVLQLKKELPPVENLYSSTLPVLHDLLLKQTPWGRCSSYSPNEAPRVKELTGPK